MLVDEPSRDILKRPDAERPNTGLPRECGYLRGERIAKIHLALGGARNAMLRACEAAGTAHYSPHDLRHRYASLKIAEGVPVTQVAAQLGHSRNSLTLDRYSHVIVAD